MVRREAVRKVVATFPGRAALVLGITHGVGAILLLSCAGAVFGMRAFTSVGGTALLTGVPLLACGILAYFSGKKKEVWLITGYLLCGICTLIFSLSLVGAASTGITYEPSRVSKYSVASRQAVDILALVLTILVAISLVWAIVLCGLALFYGCCKPIAGAKYVTEPAKVESEQNVNDTVVYKAESSVESQPQEF